MTSLLGASAVAALAVVLLGQLDVGSLLGERLLTLTHRLALAGREWLATLLLLGLAGLAAAFGERARRLVALPLRAAALCTLAVSLYGHVRSGAYLDPFVLRAWLTRPEWMLRVASPLAALATFGGALGAALALHRFEGWLLASPGPRRTLTRAVLGLMALALLLERATWVESSPSDQLHVGDTAILLSPDRSPADLKPGAYRALYAGMRARRSGPVTSFVGQLFDDPASRMGFAIERPWAGRELRPREPEVALQPKRKLNVLLVVVESFRSDLLAPGALAGWMPHLEALSSRAIRFTEARTPGPLTHLGVPAILGGQHPFKVLNPMLTLRREEPSPTLLHVLLGRAGWSTAFFSSEGMTWFGMDDQLRPDLADMHLDPDRYAADMEAARSAYARHGVTLAHLQEGNIDDRVVAGELADWSGKQTRPWFAYLKLQGTHRPYELPPGIERTASKSDPDLSAEELENNLFGGFPPERRELMVHRYQDAAHQVDVVLDTLLGQLQARGELERTLVIVTGDHGESFGELNRFAHGTGLTEEQLHIPLLALLPGEAPRTIDAPVSLLDIAPLVLSQLGLPPHPGHDGLDPLGPIPADRPLFFVCQSPSRLGFGVMRGSLKHVVETPPQSLTLHDIAGAGGEREDLSTAQPERFERLHRGLARWFDTQVEYHRDAAMQARSWPPKLVDPEAAEAP